MASSSNEGIEREMEGIRQQTCSMDDHDDLPLPQASSLNEGVNRREDAVRQVSECGSNTQNLSSDEDASWNPLEDDHARDLGLSNVNDPALNAAGVSLFKERRAKDVPCKFHDGFSQTCWKGSRCPYGHDLYTGGRFAKIHPEVAMQTGARQATTSTTDLPPKSILNREAQFLCRVTHVVSPSDFFIEATNGTECFCTRLVETFLKEEKKKAEEEAKKGAQPNDQLDAYDYGFNCLEQPSISRDLPDPTLTSTLKPLGSSQLLNNYLQNGLTYRKYQVAVYKPFAELAAVRINGKWMRAQVLSCIDGDNTAHGAQLVRFQLLDSGEKVTVSIKDTCRLPQKFTNTPGSAFRCCLFGISPVYFVWNTVAVNLFKELVKNKEILVIVKESIPTDQSVTLFESRPYVVKLLVKTDDVYVDVAQKLLEKGHALQWSPYPFRPFAKNKIEPSGLEAVYEPNHKPLPANALKIENLRLASNFSRYELLRKPKVVPKVMNPPGDA